MVVKIVNFKDMIKVFLVFDNNKLVRFVIWDLIGKYFVSVLFVFGIDLLNLIFL